MFFLHSHVVAYLSNFLLDFAPLSKATSNVDPKEPKKYIKQFTIKFDEIYIKELK